MSAAGRTSPARFTGEGSTSAPPVAAEGSEFPDDLITSTTSATHLTGLGAWHGPSLAELHAAGAGVAGGVGLWGLARLRAALTGTGVPTLADLVAPGWLPPSTAEGAEAARSGADDVAQWAAQARSSVLDDFASITAVARDSVHAALTHPVAASLGAPSVIPAPIAAWAQVDSHGRPTIVPPAHPSAEEQASMAYDPQRVYLAQWASRMAAAADQARQETDTPQGRRSSAANAGWRLPWDRAAHPTPISLADWNSWFDETGKLDAARIPRVGEDGPATADMPAAAAVGKAARAQIFSRGIAADARRVVWPYLLGVYAWDSTLARRDAVLTHLEAEYTQWTARAQALLRYQKEREKEKNSSQPDSAPDIEPATEPATEPAAAESSEIPSTEIAYPTLRPAHAGLWAQDTDLDLDIREERRRIRLDSERTDREHVLFRAPEQPLGSTEDEAGDTPEDGPMPTNIHIRALNTILVAFVLWDTRASTGEGGPAGVPAKLGGYAQGVSDICAVLYGCLYSQEAGSVAQTSSAVEALTFASLRALLTRFGWSAPFRRDQKAMTAALGSLRGMLRTCAPDTYSHLTRLEADNLFFAYRWLLVTFKRELPLEDTCRVWEAIWAADSELAASVSLGRDDAGSGAGQEGPGAAASFSLVLAYALIVRETLALAQLQVFDETLHYFNSLAPAPGTSGAGGEQPTMPASNDLLSRASRAARDQPGLWPPPPLSLPTRP